MSTPSLIVHLALGQAPLTANASAVWTDVSSYASGADDAEHNIHRGKNHERDVVEAGTAIVTLNNKDRRFDPQNNAGPYYGQLKPMVKIRIGALWSATTYWLFYGYVESWQPQYHGGTVSTCIVEAVDAFKYFGMNYVQTTTSRAAERSGNRISYVLDSWVYWPASERAIALGDIDVAAMPFDGSALSIMQAVTLAERGNLYISKNGTLTFEDRSWRDAASPVATWGDAVNGSELPYASITVRNDDSDLFNQVEVTRRDGLLQRAFDTPSQTAFFLRTFQSTGLPYVDDTEAMAAAHVLLARSKDARPRLERMVIDPGVRNTWLQVLSRELSDMITVKRRYLADADVDTMDAHIEAIDYHITKGLWVCTWQLTPHFTAAAGTAAVMTGSKWITVDGGIGFQNGWHNLGGTNGPVEYWKDADGWVYLRGLAAGGTVGTSGSTMFTLPVGYRPPRNTFQPVMSSGVLGEVGIQTDGDVPAISGSNIYFDLSAIRFKVN